MFIPTGKPHLDNPALKVSFLDDFRLWEADNWN